MSGGVIFVFESNKHSQSDYHYIRAILKENYDTGKFRDHPIFAGSKSKLIDNVSINKKITEILKKSGILPKVVIFADIDSGFTSDLELNKKNTKFCQENHYELVWFNRNIEEVVLGKPVEKKEKVKTANNFTISKIYQHALKNMNVKDPFKLYKTSNLFKILDNVLPKKN